MATIKLYTDLEQSKKLAEILSIKSADMEYMFLKKDGSKVGNVPFVKDGFEEPECCYTFIPCWSLAALLEELNRNLWKVSLKCCGAEWDITYDDGEKYISVSSDYAIDACYEMILKLHEQKLL